MLYHTARKMSVRIEKQKLVFISRGFLYPLLQARTLFLKIRKNVLFRDYESFFTIIIFMSFHHSQTTYTALLGILYSHYNGKIIRL